MPTTIEIEGKRTSERSFGLRVRDDSMINPAGSPTYPPGCTVIVDPDRAPRTGDRVIVAIPGVAEPTLKLYTVDSGRVLLRAYNPQIPALAWQEGMRVLGIVVHTVMDW